MGVCREMTLKRWRVLSPFPLAQTLLQRLCRVDVLLARAAEQDQHQLRRGQGIGAGVVALAHMQVEVVDPVVQPGLANMRIRAQKIFCNPLGTTSAGSR